MSMYGNCPKCAGVVESLELSTLTASAPGGRTYQAATFLCPHCKTVLGASLDPVAVATDAANRASSAVYDVGSQVAKKFEDLLGRLKPGPNQP